jgi:chromate transporter
MTHSIDSSGPVALSPAESRKRLKEVALLFTRLGFTAFGGPPAHVAMMEDEVVGRRKWVDHQHFLDLLAAVNFVPGPNSTEMAIHLGHVRAGFAGLVTAGVCFITPAVLIILPLAYLYVKSGSLPQVTAAFGGINACVVAIIAAATIRFARSAVTDLFTAIVGVTSVLMALGADRFPQLQPELLILAAAAIAGAIYYGRPRIPSAPMMFAFLPLAVSPELNANLLRTFLLFLKVGVTLFGSGYVLVSYLQSGLVDQYHWLSKKELLDAIAVGQVTPGPLLTTATFVGYVLGAQKFGGGVVGGIVGGIVATIGIFLPSFFFLALLGTLLPKIRENKFARGMLRSMNAAVVALMAVVCWRLGAAALTYGGHWGSPDWISIAIVIASFAAIMIWDISTTWLILAAGLIGVVRLV